MGNQKSFYVFMCMILRILVHKLYIIDAIMAFIRPVHKQFVLHLQWKIGTLIIMWYVEAYTYWKSSALAQLLIYSIHKSTLMHIYYHICSSFVICSAALSKFYSLVSRRPTKTPHASICGEQLHCVSKRQAGNTASFLPRSQCRSIHSKPAGLAPCVVL